MTSGEPHLDVAIVADDMTGMLDAAAPFAGCGLATVAQFGMPHIWGDAPPDTQVLAADTESRHIAPPEAAERVRAAVQAMVGRKPRLLVKKIDSTLRGNVVAETLAALRASGRRRAVLAPAVPAHGRSFADGRVCIDGVTLADTAIGRDALSAPPTQSMLPLFATDIGAEHVHHWGQGEDVPPAADGGRHVVIADCASDADLDRIVRMASCEDTLFVGASGLCAALARHCALPARSTNAGSTVRGYAGPVVFVIGSRAPQSAAQLAQLIAAGVAPVAIDVRRGAPERFAVGHLPDGHVAVFPDAATGERDATEVAQALAAAAESLVLSQDARTLVIVGGDTAAATFRALGLVSLAVAGEVMPGLPLSHALAGERRMAVVTKAGGFGAADTLVEVLRRMTGARNAQDG